MLVVVETAAGVVVVAGVKSRAAGGIAGAAGPAGGRGRRFGQGQPAGSVRARRPHILLPHSLQVVAPYYLRTPVNPPVGLGYAGLIAPGKPLRIGGGAPTVAFAAQLRANQAAHLPAARDFAHRELLGVGADIEPFDPLGAPFLSGKLKDAVDADPGNAGFPFGQPALLGGDKAAELAAFPEIDGVIPFIAVFAGCPGFGLGKGVRLVDAALEGLAPVFGQGFQDGRSPVGMGKGLPVGAVPGDGTGLGRWIPPPLRKTPLKRQGRPLHFVGTWQFPLG